MRCKAIISLFVLITCISIPGLLTGCKTAEVTTLSPVMSSPALVPSEIKPTSTSVTPTDIPSANLLPSPSITPTTARPAAATPPAGKIYRAGKFRVLTLQGSYYEMGGQYGRFLKDDLIKLYPAVVDEYLIKSHKLSLQKVKDWVNPRYALYPEKVKQFIEGAADATGIELEKLIVLSSLTDLARITPDSVGCSSIAAWGQYTSKGPLVFGRNFDWWGHYKNFNSYITLTVFKPDDGSLSFASVGWVGELLLQTGMNSAGIFAESNDAELSIDSTFLDNRIHPSIQSISIMANSRDLRQFDETFKSSPVARVMTMNVADSKGAYSYECSLSDIKKRGPDEDGLLIVTNHFVDSSWTGLRKVNDEFQTETRRRNLLALGEKNKGSFTPQAMMRVLDTSVEQGGATRPETIYQVIAVPEQLKMWLKAAGYADWTEIDLRPLLF